MATPLPRLRMDLDFMPSPVADRPGLVIRDPYHFSDATLIIPPPLVACLEHFDGERTNLDLRAVLVRVTGDLDVSDLERHLVETLSSAGFLHDDNYQRMREERRREFAAADLKEPSHAGSAYPAEESELRATLRNYLGDVPGDGVDGLLGIAAPHVSPFGGWESYRAGYRALGQAYRDRVFVILGTSHYGEPNRFGLTRKSFKTPYGTAPNETRLVNELTEKAAESINMEDYCHAVEHSIEFQVVFLQHLFGPEVKILPILCGSYAQSIYQGGKPEDDERVKRFLGSLGEIAAREKDRLTFVLGIDMAHMGTRYGDSFPALADQDEMLEVAARDHKRIGSMNGGDADGFWAQVQEGQDSLKWCGSSPVYTFMKAVPQARGELVKYQQWNIDEQSVVTFAGMTFREAES